MRVVEETRRQGDKDTRNILGARLPVLSFFCLLVSLSPCLPVSSDSSAPPDPAEWGSDHVGKPVPEYVGGDECLFCHRDKIGPAWSDNWHNLTVRDADPNSPALVALKQSVALKGFADEARIVLGGRQRLRFLKPDEAYGKLDLLSISWEAGRDGQAGKLLDTDRPHWDAKHFGDACAGCHATAVDVKNRAFAARSLDCYVCHGEVSLEHSKNTALVHLSRKRNDRAAVVTSICAQCHVRSGKSKSTGLPYPNNFVAGDNLFRDFQVDLSPQRIARENPADAHVLQSVRDVVLLGKLDSTCLSCHDVHKESATKHHLVRQSDLCLHCHNAGGPKKVRKSHAVHSQTCEY